MEGLLTKETDMSAFHHDQCDKYDYLLAIASGSIAGLVDILFVGDPTDSKLQQWSDGKVDDTVEKFARLTGWDKKGEKTGNTKSAIGYLENKFRVNYDHRHSGDVDDLFRMSTKDHHLKSLAHSPDIIGLFFSIVNQFTSTATFVSDGQLITISAEDQELKGGNFPAKLFAGTVNWLGHLMSDVAGSSGAVGRGSGLAIPFYELFQFAEFGKFNVGKDKQTLAEIANRAFKQGYDFRHGLTMAIPVLLEESLIRFMWAIKRYVHDLPLKECLPTSKHDNLRVMLIVGNGVLCVMDGADASIRSGGNWLNFFMRLNLIAWFRFIQLVLREIYLRTDFSELLDKQLTIHKQINLQLTEYLTELKQLDVEAYEEEVAQLSRFHLVLEADSNPQQVTHMLYQEMNQLGMDLPFTNYDEFIEFMNQKDSKLIF